MALQSCEVDERNQFPIEERRKWRQFDLFGLKPDVHRWRRSWREKLFGTLPLKKCECGRLCWMDRPT